MFVTRVALLKEAEKENINLATVDLLTPRERELLALLLERAGIVIPEVEILARLREREEREISQNTARMCLCAVRKKLQSTGITRRIETIRKRGIRWVPVSELLRFS